MKKIILINLLVFFAISVNAQKIKAPVDSVTHKITYQEIVNLKGSRDTLYFKALHWLEKFVSSQNFSLQTNDIDNGRMVIKWTIQPEAVQWGTVSTSFTILFKNGKYKYILTNFQYDGTSNMGAWDFEEEPNMFKVNMTKSQRNRIKDETYTQVINAIDDLKKTMAIVDKPADF